jgi:hypothetical protein
LKGFRMATEYPTDEGVPPRVLAAESRRKSRQLLENSSLFCQKCYHNLGEHLLIDISGTARGLDTMHGKCTHVSCACPGPHIDEVHPNGVL